MSIIRVVLHIPESFRSVDRFSGPFLNGLNNVMGIIKKMNLDLPLKW